MQVSGKLCGVPGSFDMCGMKTKFVTSRGLQVKANVIVFVIIN